ncbi:hypothetical protein [Aureivirga marina]|uniref:hypothetical protein n=1 Tax=Aureivirga marina TaxID=1182451 RepID=UPI0018C93A3E|nr:hypothetical protein [Aureivirga marina]
MAQENISVRKDDDIIKVLTEDFGNKSKAAGELIDFYYFQVKEILPEGENPVEFLKEMKASFEELQILRKRAEIGLKGKFSKEELEVISDCLNIGHCNPRNSSNVNFIMNEIFDEDILHQKVSKKGIDRDNLLQKILELSPLECSTLIDKINQSWNSQDSDENKFSDIL